MNFYNLIPTLLLAIALGGALLYNYALIENIQYQRGIQLRDSEPASDWYEVTSVWVDDFQIGGDPRMIIDREIKRDFYGTWVADFEKITNGGAVYICGFSGRADYTTDAKLPHPLSLSWWLYEKGNTLDDCMRNRGVDTGEYRVCTTWRIYPEGYNEKRTRICSNVFSIR